MLYPDNSEQWKTKDKDRPFALRAKEDCNVGKNFYKKGDVIYATENAYSKFGIHKTDEYWELLGINNCRKPGN